MLFQMQTLYSNSSINWFSIHPDYRLCAMPIFAANFFLIIF